MYSKQEAAQIKQKFWTNFGQYMKPVPFAGGEKNSWINYKTGVQHIYFRMAAEKTHASIAIELTNPSSSARVAQYEQFGQLKTLLYTILGEEWIWEENRVYQKLEDVNVFKESDWPPIISFLKPRIIALDTFWEEVRDGFEG